MRQKAGRFEPEECVQVSHAEAVASTVGGSVVLSTQATYDSRLRTLCRFLAWLRVVTLDLVVPTSCSEGEFFQFLYNWKLQKMGPAKGIRSALLLEHRKLGIHDSFLLKDVVKRATKGASANHVPSQKGVLSAGMVHEWAALVDSSPFEDLNIPCESCGLFGWTRAKVKRMVIVAGFLMFELPIRPANLKDLRDADVLVAEGLVVIQRPKVETKDRLPLTPRIVELFQHAAAVRGAGEYVFPRCITEHLDVALRLAEELYEWPPGLVWSPHCLKHSAVQNAAGKVQDAVLEFVTQTSASVANATYLVPLAKRLKKT